MVKSDIQLFCKKKICTEQLKTSWFYQTTVLCEDLTKTLHEKNRIGNVWRDITKQRFQITEYIDDTSEKHTLAFSTIPPQLNILHTINTLTGTKTSPHWHTIKVSKKQPPLGVLRYTLQSLKLEYARMNHSPNKQKTVQKEHVVLKSKTSEFFSFFFFF